MWVALAILVAVIILLIAILPRRSATSREEVMTVMNLESASSYEQKTNHLPMTEVNMGPIAGTETPYRVNMHQSYST